MRWKKLFHCLVCRSNHARRRKEPHPSSSTTNAAKLVDDMDPEVDMFSFQISLEDGTNNAVEDAMSLMSSSSIQVPKPLSSSVAALPPVALVTTNPTLPPPKESTTSSSTSTRIPSSTTTTTTTNSQYANDASTNNRQENETVSAALVLQNVASATDSSVPNEQSVVAPMPDDDSMPMDELNHWKQANASTTTITKHTTASTAISTSAISTSTKITPRPPLSTMKPKVPPPAPSVPPPPKVPPPPPLMEDNTTDWKSNTNDSIINSPLPPQRLKRRSITQEEEENTHPNIFTQQQQQQQSLAIIPPWYSMSANPNRIRSSASNTTTTPAAIASTATTTTTTTTIRRSSSKQRSSTSKTSAASVQSQGSDPFSDLSSHANDDDEELLFLPSQNRTNVVSDEESDENEKESTCDRFRFLLSEKTHPIVLSSSIMNQLIPFLPVTTTSNTNVWLKYSLVRDGANYNTLLHKICGAISTILVIQTTQGDVFGSFTNVPWRLQPRVFGNGQAFVWKVVDSEQQQHVVVYPAQSSIPNQVCRKDQMGIGVTSDGWALCIQGDSLQQGTSSSSSIFQNPSLCKDVFVIANMEVWTLTPFSTIDDAQAFETRRLLVEGYKHRSISK